MTLHSIPQEEIYPILPETIKLGILCYITVNGRRAGHIRVYLDGNVEIYSDFTNRFNSWSYTAITTWFNAYKHLIVGREFTWNLVEIMPAVP